MDGHGEEANTAMRIHELRAWPEFFKPVLEGTKRAEWRRDDRGGFEVGDYIVLREWDPAKADYTGYAIAAEITHVLHGGELELPAGYAVLSIDPLLWTDDPYDELLAHWIRQSPSELIPLVAQVFNQCLLTAGHRR